ncbi:MAG: DUF1772 domain-containing protein [Actinobacteria bacterium]|nr:DUF1772 domain-containing protein [Actinomycetota bacterium]
MNHDFIVGKLPLLLSSLWVGGAAYVAFISTQGRERLDNATKLKAWADEFRPSLKVLGGLAAVSSAAGFYAYYVTKNLNFIYGASAMALCFPYTLIFISPLYKPLLKADEEDAPSDKTTTTINSWVSAHKGRLLIGAIGALLFLFAESTHGIKI